MSEEMDQGSGEDPGRFMTGRDTPENQSDRFFLCIGAVKSGTTWLHSVLKHHPDVWLTPIKEIRYFNESERERRMVLRRFRGHRFAHWRYQLASTIRHPRRLLTPTAPFFHLRFFLLPRTPAWYSNLFVGAGEKLTGDITPMYATISSEEVAFVRSVVPHARVIYLLRNPIDRFWSHVLLYCKNRVRGDFSRITEELVRQVVLDESERNDHLWQSGMYDENLTRWEEHFPAEQIHIGFYDDLKRRPDEYLDGILDFLGLPSWRPSDGRLTTRFNKKRTSLGLPRDLEAFIARRYLPELVKIEKRFGGPTTDWLREAERIAWFENRIPEKYQRER